MAGQTNSSQIDTILRKILAHQREMSCDDCFDVLDRYADLLRAGQDPAAILPGVRDHLAACGDCDDEFKALLAILESASSSNSSSTTSS